jgi:hypothetical protein
MKSTLQSSDSHVGDKIKDFDTHTEYRFPHTHTEHHIIIV